MVRRSPDDLPSYEEEEDRIVYIKQSNMGYNALVQTIFVATVLGAGGIIWNLMARNERLEHRVTILEYKCESRPLERGG